MAILRELGGIEEYEALIQLACAEARLAAGEDATAALAAGGARLRERAAFIPTPEGRARFLENDSVNRALAALCEARGVEVRS